MNLKIDDSVLVKEYMKGSEMAFEILIKKHNQSISSFIYSKVKKQEVTDDIFQETFIKVIKTLKKGGYKEDGKFLPWVMRIAYNQIMDYFRREAKMNKYERTDEFDIFEVLEEEIPNVEEQIINKQTVTDIQGLILELPRKQREVLKMRLYSKMSFKEIAEEMDISINTALGRMRYALINLKKIAEENEIILR